MKKKLEDFPRKFSKFEVLYSGTFHLSFLIRLLRFNYKIANIIIVTKMNRGNEESDANLTSRPKQKVHVVETGARRKRGTVHFPRGTSRH